MNKQLETIARESRPTLSDTERAAMRSEFMVHMEKNPVKVSILSPYMHFAGVYAFAALLLVSVPTLYAAERSLPSDVLYPLKVEVIERLVVSAASVSEAAEADVRTSLLERRLKEARLLALDGRLGAEESSVVSRELAAHIENLQQYAEESESEGNLSESLETSSELEATLGGYERALAVISQTTPEDDVYVDGLTETLALERRESQNSSEEVEGDLAADMSSESAQYLAEVSDDAERIVMKARRAANAAAAVEFSVATAALAIVEGAEDALAAAHSSEASGAAGSAITEYRDALRAASESLILLGAGE